MECEYCKNKIPIDAKFCNKCGKSVKKNELKENIKNSAKETGMGGLLKFFVFTLFVSMIYTFIDAQSVFSELLTFNLEKSRYYIYILLFSLYYSGLIFFLFYTITSFSKLKPNSVALGKMYLVIIFFASLIALVNISSNRELVSDDYGKIWYSIICFFYLFSSVRIKNTFPKKNRIIKKLDIVYFAIILLLLLSINTYAKNGYIDEKMSSKFISTNESFTNQEVESIVEEMKKITVLPKVIDDSTKLVDFTAQNNAIRYHYEVLDTDIDTNILSDAYLKDYFISNVCQNNDALLFLEKGINLEYFFVVINTELKYLVTFAKNDCI